MPSATLRPDLDEIRRSILLFMEPGAVVELRVPKAGYDGTISGYFSDPEKLTQAAASVNGKGSGVYVTINRLPPNLLARSANRTKIRARTTTRDDEIIWRRWLLLDFDPTRPAGISSTEAEHDAALSAAHSAKETLDLLNWPEPILADSGNGGHLLYAIDLPADKTSLELVKNTLKSAAKRFGSATVNVDVSVFNASRISKLYGTVAAKGDSTPERPHRLSRIIDLPDTPQPVDLTLLQALAAESETVSRPVQQPYTSNQPYTGNSFDLDGFISRHGISISRGPIPDNGSEKWILTACPFNPDHKAPDAAIFRNPSGALIFKCFHNSCAENGWKEFRQFYEPNRQVRQLNGHAEGRLAGGSEVAVISERHVADALAEAVESAIEQGVESCYQPALAREFAIAYLSGAESLIKANTLKAKLKDKFKADLNLTRFSDGVRAIRDEIRSVRHQPTGLKEGDIDLLRYGLNDQGNAERIRAVFGDDMRFCPDFKRWVIWDERRWVVDGSGKARQMAKEAMRKFLGQAGSYDEEFAKFASKSLNEKPLTAMLKMLESDIPVSSSELDRDPWELNCLNGTVDLRTAELLPHSRTSYITKIVHFNYDPAADCPLWLKFLFFAMGDSEEASPAKVERAACMVSYIQRALGYSITGVTSEKAVFIPLGEFGNNGKSTMLDTVRRIIKEYSALLSVDTLMVRQESNNTQADLADLRGARFVQTSETEESQSLSQGKLKMLTAGMGTVKACRKFENPIEFEANFHIWLDTNKMPHIKDPDDTATLSRMHPIPFLVQISKIDQAMPDKLYAEAEGILAWMVAGAQDWFLNRLQRPEEVTEARENWKSAQEDPWTQTVETWIEKQNEAHYAPTSHTYYTASISAILEGALGFKVKDMGQHRGEAIRLGRILKRVGWVIDKQTGANRIRVYRKATEMALTG